MGKKKYTQGEVSPQKTALLGIPDLLVLDNGSDNDSYYAVHQSYFRCVKSVCPACGSNRTRCSKVLKRKFKDILSQDGSDFKIVNLFFYQRYFRCDGCGSSVFPERIEFGEKGCRYTNRLSDKLADGTFTYSYKKVCNYYGVPASTASVGAIMRRRIQYREAMLPPLKTPSALGVFEAPFYDKIFPVILATWDDEVYCLDILEESSEEAYSAFFRKLEIGQIKTVYIDPVESLRNAAYTYFPMASIEVSDECILRYARNAMLDIIHEEGKRFPIRHKYDSLTQRTDFLQPYTREKIEEGLSCRPRLKNAYAAYQQLIMILQNDWSKEDITDWVSSLPDELSEFEATSDLIDFYGDEVQTFRDAALKPPERYATTIRAICDVISSMPHCIYEVLRARAIFTIANDTITENEEVSRLGIRTDRLIENMNNIAINIKEEREYGL